MNTTNEMRALMETIQEAEGLDRQNIRLSKIEEIKAKYHNLAIELDEYADELEAEGSTASAASINNIIGGMMSSFELFDAAISDMGLSSGRLK
jgi:molecular chaperone GrpE (heat shock protein)